MEFRLKKRCPRCNTKTESTTVVCPQCRLNYQKFEQATNSVAKQKIKEGEKHQVLMRTSRPADVKFWKLLLMGLLLGFMGGHHYYVGRYKMGIFYTVFFMIGVANAVINTMVKTIQYSFMYEIFYLLVLFE